jgi:pimeloyl-ACP methyl ester carboxylesterase
MIEFRRVIGGALRAMLCDELPATIAVKKKPEETKLAGGVTVHTAHLGRTDEKDAVPTIGMFTAKFNGEKAVVWIHPKGKGSVTDNGTATEDAKKLLDAGYAIVAPDVLGVGELISAKPRPINQTYAGFTYGYNRSLLAERVHDVLTAICFAKTVLKAKTIRLVGWDELGVPAILAAATAGGAISKLAADLGQFRFENITKTDDPMMLPGAIKYGGMGAFLALCAPTETLAHNHKGTASGKVSKAAFDAAGAGYKLTRADAKWDAAKVIEWLLK